MLIKLGFTLPKTLLCDGWSEFMKNILYIDSNKCFACTVYVIDLLLTVTDKCQWLEYLFIDILNSYEVLYALSLFTFSLQPNVVEAGKLQN
jgi:hypothetical protein